MMKTCCENCNRFVTLGSIKNSISYVAGDTATSESSNEPTSILFLLEYSDRL
jgi:hypothetical protein